MPSAIRWLRPIVSWSYMLVGYQRVSNNDNAQETAASPYPLSSYPAILVHP
jgi:hypothetical protein